MALDVQRAVWFRFRFLLFAIWPVRSMGGFGAVSCNFRFGSFSVDCGHQLFDFGETSGECIRAFFTVPRKQFQISYCKWLCGNGFAFFHSPEKAISSFQMVLLLGEYIRRCSFHSPEKAVSSFQMVLQGRGWNGSTVQFGEWFVRFTVPAVRRLSDIRRSDLTVPFRFPNLTESFSMPA